MQQKATQGWGFGEGSKIIGQAFFGKSCWPFTLVLVGTWGGKGKPLIGGFTNRLLTLAVGFQPCLPDGPKPTAT